MTLRLKKYRRCIMEKRYIGIDIGGTFIKLGVVTETGEIIRRHKVAVDQSGQIPVMTTVIDAVKEICGSEPVSRYEGIGVSAPGSIDSVNGKVAINPGNVPNWSGTLICRPLEEAFGIPAAAANDGNCAALGEAWTGAAKGYSEVLCVTLGTGVGGGIITGGRLLEGRSGFAGEIGHFQTHAGEGEVCSCGRVGCYEKFASTSALVKKAMAIDPGWDDGHHFFEAVDAGNADALRLLDEWLDEISYGISGLLQILNSEIVLIGGGVSAREDVFMEPLRRRIFANTIADFTDGLEIRATALGNDAGMVGAVRYLIDSRDRGDK